MARRTVTDRRQRRHRADGVPAAPGPVAARHPRAGRLPAPDGAAIWPEPVLVGRNASRLPAIAERHGLTDWTTDLDAALARRRRRGLLRRPGHPGAGEGGPGGDRGRQARLHREAAGRDRRTRARAGPRAPTPPASSHGVVQDKLFLPGLRKLKRLLDGGFFGRILSVRGEFGYWVFEGDWQTAAAAVLELPRGRRRRHRAGHVPALALRAGAPVRPGPGGHARTRHPHPAPLGRVRRAVRRDRRRRRVRASSSSPAASSPRSTPPGRSGSTATSWSSSRSTAPTAAPSPGCATAAIQHRVDHAEAGVEPGPARHRATSATSGRRCRTTRSSTTGSRCSGSCSCATSSRTRPFPWDFFAGARGVQLAELGPAVLGPEGRRLEVPELHAVTHPTCPTRAAATGCGPRAEPSPRRRPPLAAASVVRGRPRGRRPARRQRPRRAGRRRLGRDARLPAPPVVARVRRGRGDGHRPARHGSGLRRRPAS